MVYAGISVNGCNDLYISTVTGPRNSNEILRPIVVPCNAEIREDFTLMGDNCRPHPVHLVGDFFLREESHQWNSQRVLWT